MFFLYNIAILLVGWVLRILAIFNKKIRLFVNGRKTIFDSLKAEISATDKVVWFHCASLGEFEQGRPIIERFKQQFPSFKILLTFFSPSGYEIRKQYEMADLVTYLPLDSKKNAKKFIEMAHPTLAVFVKYEFWPQMLKELKSKQTHTILISGIFRKEQFFFKWYGKWLQKSLQSFHHFFVQNKQSQELLAKIGILNSTVHGDTRFDRVFMVSKQDNTIDNLEDFAKDKAILVAGSTWPKDEELVINYINKNTASNFKTILAPHTISLKHLALLKSRIVKNTVLFSEYKKNKVGNAEVLIIDSIGILNKVYSYADIVYVGGGFGTGIHNILEPATFGLPIIIGPNYHKFNEAKVLINLGACKVIKNENELENELNFLFKNEEKRIERGAISKSYVQDHLGATDLVINYLKNKKLVS